MAKLKLPVSSSEHDTDIKRGVIHQVRTMNNTTRYELFIETDKNNRKQYIKTRQE